MQTAGAKNATRVRQQTPDTRGVMWFTPKPCSAHGGAASRSGCQRLCRAKELVVALRSGHTCLLQRLLRHTHKAHRA